MSRSNSLFTNLDWFTMSDLEELVDISFKQPLIKCRVKHCRKGNSRG